MPDIKIVDPNEHAAQQSTEPKPKFDLQRLRVRQDYQNLTASRPVIVNVPVQRPSNQVYFRVKAGPEWRWDTELFQQKAGEDSMQSRDLYLVDEPMRGVSYLVAHTKPYVIYTVVDQFGALQLWAVRLPDATGRPNDYWTTAHAAAKTAEAFWTRVEPSPNGRGYQVWTAENENALGAPSWPELSFQQIIDIAFGDRFIDSPEHVLCKRLRGA